jgi:cytochrome b6-f complex iron-sulfur subunit
MAVINDDVGRRRFLSQAVMGFGLLFGLGTLALRFLQFIVPAPQGKRSLAVLIGTAAQVPMHEAVPMDLGGQKIMVLRSEEGVVAFSRRCTDLGCLVSFDRTGKNIAGPPPRPLDRFEVVKRGEQYYVTIESASV